MKTRLKGCDRWHPNEVSELRIRIAPNGYGYKTPSTRCYLCDRVRSRMQAAGLPPPPRLKRQGRDPLADYGVLPRLNWIAPEFLTGELT